MFNKRSFLSNRGFLTNYELSGQLEGLIVVVAKVKYKNAKYSMFGHSRLTFSTQCCGNWLRAAIDRNLAREEGLPY